MDNGAGSYRRFLKGDDTGIVEIIRDYKDGLMLYLNGIVGNIHIAEDLMEETFVKLVTKKPHFSGKSTFKTWLYAIGRNMAMDYLRRNKRVEKVSLEESEILLKDEQLIEEQYIWENQKIRLHQAMHNLNPKYRQVLYLSFFEGFSNEESAKIMRISKRQIENLLYRAKLSLKSQLEKEGFVYEEL